MDWWISQVASSNLTVSEEDSSIATNQWGKVLPWSPMTAKWVFDANSNNQNHNSELQILQIKWASAAAIDSTLRWMLPNFCCIAHFSASRFQESLPVAGKVRQAASKQNGRAACTTRHNTSDEVLLSGDTNVSAIFCAPLQDLKTHLLLAGATVTAWKSTCPFPWLPIDPRRRRQPRCPASLSTYKS